MLILILMVFGFVFFFLAGFGVPPTGTGRFNLLGLGLMCWILADMLAKWPVMGTR